MRRLEEEKKSLKGEYSLFCEGPLEGMGSLDDSIMGDSDAVLTKSHEEFNQGERLFLLWSSISDFELVIKEPRVVEMVRESFNAVLKVVVTIEKLLFVIVVFAIVKSFLGNTSLDKTVVLLDDNLSWL